MKIALFSALRTAFAGLFLLSLLFQALVPAVALAKLKVAPGYKECPGGYQVKIAQDCQTSDLLFFGCMVLTIAAATAAFFVASLGGLVPPWGFVAMAAVFAFGATNCPHSTPSSPPPPSLVPDLVPQGLKRTGTLNVGQTQTFTGSIKNIGTGVSVAGAMSRLCVDNANCASSTAGSLGNVAIPAIAAGILSPLTPQTWNATIGNHTVYFCVVGRSCTSLSFTVAAAPTLNPCTLDALTWNSGTEHPFYNATVVPTGQQCSTGTNTSGQPYAKNLLCTNGVISGDTSGTYIHSNCNTQVIPQSDISLTVNDTLVRKGSSTLLAWDGGNSTSCTLTGTNGLSQTGFSGRGTVSSGVIDQRTLFTLTCTLDAETKTETVTVELVPVVREI